MGDRANHRAAARPVAREGERADRVERLGLALLLAALVVVWWVEWQPFLLPNNDWYSFERTAQSLARGELPSGFKRMPLFPAAMALLAPWMPGPHPYLTAALVLNQAFSLGFLVVLFALARNSFGRGALLAPVLMAANVQFHAMGLQPLVEPSLGFFTVLAFWLFQRRSAWQWAAAFAVGLSRYEAAVLIPVLFVANWWRDGRFWRQVAFAALASSGLGVWLLLTLTEGSGSGGGFYFQLMEGMGWQPAPGFYARSVKEPFRGWYAPRWWMAPPFLVAVGVPLAVGVATGWRRFRSETLALGLFWIAAISLVVGFGIDKARYVYHTQWIPIFFWAAGLPRLIAFALGRAPRARWLRLAGLAAAASLLVACVGAWLVRIAGDPAAIHPMALELALAGVAFAVGAVACFRASPEGAGALARLAAVCGALVLVVPILGGGIRGKVHTFWKIYHANYAATLVAPWLQAHLGPEERALVAPRSHIEFLTGFEAGRFDLFAEYDAASPEELAAALRSRGVDYVVYTWRRRPDDPSERFYWRASNADLADWFSDGGPVPGFVHVDTLAVPEEVERRSVQIYRVLPAEDERGGGTAPLAGRD